MKKYRIANKNDKEDFYRKMQSEIESTIWEELILGQKNYLEVEINIVPVETWSEE